jgi:hypothetical protein
MSQVITFEDYRPAPRYDATPWTEAKVYEAPSPSGPWVLIDTIALVPVDSDPANPVARNLTTANASDTDELWYQIVFFDAGGATSSATSPVQNVEGEQIAPCSPWLIGDDVADCCSVETSDGTIFDDYAIQAQELLYELSGRQFAGICSQKARPCWTNCGCGWQVLSRGHLVYQNDSWFCNDSPCGCSSLSRVKLGGYPIVSIVEVKVNGDVIDPNTYRVDANRYLTRVRDPADPDTALSWPGCQNLALEDTEDGTFSVTYSYGMEPPAIGVAAAAQLACELYKSCPGNDAAGDCALPSGTVRIVRQGVTIEKAKFISWAFERGGQGVQRGWNTGLSSVDAFLNAYNPTGLMRRPVFWSPSMSRRYAQHLGT